MTANEYSIAQFASSITEASLLTRRRLLGVSGLLALSGCLGGGNEESSNTETDGRVANAPVPSDPSSYTYATAGPADRPTVTYYGNWKCPYCADFSTSFLNDIVADYVAQGDINLRFRALAYINGEPFLGADAPRAARAGLAVWNMNPKTYWRYHEYVFAEQPSERERWATTDKLVSFAERAGVTETKQIRTKLQNQVYEAPVRKTSQAATDAGISGTPALLIDGETVNPLSDQQRTRNLIEQLADES